MFETEAIKEFKNKCHNALNEEEVRVAINGFLDKILDNLDIDVDKHNEFTLLKGGRVDSVYSNILFELKAPNVFNSQKGKDEAIYGRDESDRGLFHYLINSSIENPNIDDDYFKYAITKKIGVGFDGKKFIFCRFKESTESINIYNPKKTNSLPPKISEIQNLEFEIDYIDDFDMGVNRLLLYIRSTDRKILSASDLLNSFSSNSKLSKKYIPYLYELLESNLNKNNRITTLYTEWNRIFGEIYGQNETDFTKFSDELISMYNLKYDKIDIKKMLFVLQTYYSIVTKLLIHNLLESLSSPSSINKSFKTHNEVRALFSGKLYSEYCVENFFEIHFFEWFMLSEDFDVDIINEINSELSLFETTASVIKPEIVEDALKNVYINLIPKKLRHLMGEYYTPNWLVDFTIDKSNYDYDLNSNVLDPTCGSGTFLIHIIKKLRKKYKNELDNNELINTIVKNIVGFDINPIAVISSKANYILSLGDITQFKDPISIPIYMCDSILVPTVHAKQRENNNSIIIDTVVGNFEVPVFSSREDNDYFLKKASSCVMSDYTTFDEFYSLIKKENVISIEEYQMDLAEKFYEKLCDLHYSGKNGFWPIILKNSFAPLFMQDKFDYLVGNPPWINWKSMSDTYRTLTLDIWLSYGIFEKDAYDKITTHDDFAMAVVYVSIDHYLKEHGHAAFILPQTFVKSSKGGEGFRKFTITRDKQNINFSINEVYDMLEIKPFAPMASNKTSVYIFEKNKLMSYPMDNYFLCENTTKPKIKYEDEYKDVMKRMKITQLSAKPINDNPRSPWLTMNKQLLDNIDKYLGESPYKGRKGIEPCGAKGIYLLDIDKEIDDSNIIIKNLIERSRLQEAKEYGVHKGVVEKDFIYPMVGGRNFDKWGINSHVYIIVPHNNTGTGIYRGIDEKELKVNFQKTYEWLYYFKDLLLATRIRSGKFFDKDQFPFYRLDNVGDYTFYDYKVVWKEQSKKLTSAVISNLDDEYLGNKTILTDSKVLFVPLNNRNEAFYLCGILNSRIIGEIVEAYTIDTQRGVDIVKNIKIPLYNDNNSLHREIAKLSEDAHKQYELDNFDKIEDIVKQLEPLVIDLFNE